MSGLFHCIAVMLRVKRHTKINLQQRYHQHQQLWSQRPLESDASLTIFLHLILSRTELLSFASLLCTNFIRYRQPTVRP